MFKKFISMFCLVSFISMYAPTFAVNVPANTSIFISPVDTVTSKDQNVTTILCNITDDVIIDNVVVFKAGDRAELHVGEVEKARCWGKGGKMLISNGFAYDVNGQKHKILFSRNVYGEASFYYGHWRCSVLSMAVKLRLRQLPKLKLS